MAHHKRRRPKHQRAGCLLCKSHKDERVKGDPSQQAASVRRRLVSIAVPPDFGGAFDYDDPDREQIAMELEIDYRGEE